MAKYRVHVGGNRYRSFSTPDEAKGFCEAEFQRSGIVLAIEEKPLSKKAQAALVTARVNRAVVGFQIPMLSIPKLYTELENAVAAGKSDDDLKAVVAAFPGVIASN